MEKINSWKFPNKLKTKISKQSAKTSETVCVVKTYSKRPQCIRLAKQFILAPNFCLLLILTRIDVKSYEIFVNTFPPHSEEQENIRDFRSICSLSDTPPDLLLNWDANSVIARIARAAKFTKVTQRNTSVEQVRQFYKLLSLLPYYAKNLAVQIVLRARLSSEHFIDTYPRFLRNKNSTRDEYAGKIFRLAQKFDMSVVQFEAELCATNSKISDLELRETIYLQCQLDTWLGAYAAQYITALKDLGAEMGSNRFHTQKWKDSQKQLKKTFGTRRSEQRGRKNISKTAIKACFDLLKRQGQYRRAEFVRFLALTGQRNIDYKKLKPGHITFNMQTRTITIFWEFAKNRQVYLGSQKTLHPFGYPGQFYDLYTCCKNLLKLQPERSTYLLRFSRTSQNKVLRQCFQELPQHLQPDCIDHLTPYFFKNVMARCCLESKVAAEAVAHYMHHTLSEAEWKQFCSNSRINLSKVSTNYAIGQDLLPHIETCMGKWWSA